MSVQAFMSANIRPATRADLSQVASLCQTWVAEHLTRGYRADSVEELEKRLGECFLVAVVDGRVVAFVIGELRPTAGNEFVEGVLDDRPAYLEVQDLYVVPTHRRNGIGTRLVNALVDIANGRGVTGSLVYSANHDYIGTARFYESLGYRMWHIHMTRGGTEK